MARDDLKLVPTPMHLSPTRPNWAEISASALRHNYSLIRAQAEQLNAQAICVIKANAYGHGIAGCARVLSAAGATWLAVTSVDEGIELVRSLRQESNGSSQNIPRILILGGLFVAEDARRAIRHQLTPVIFSLQHLHWLAEAAARECSPPEKVRFHLEIDTGMARHGIRRDDTTQIDAISSLLKEQTSLVPEAVLTHFASPDEPASPQNPQQMQYFTSVVQRLYEEGVRPSLLHAGNSITLFDGPQTDALMNLAQIFGFQLLLRPGLALYGYGVPNAGLQQVLTWKTRITGVRRLQAGDAVSYNATFHSMRASTIATLAVGYADGYNRLLSNRGTVLIRGERAPVVGRVTMDQTMVDISNIEGAVIGDEAVLLGAQGDFNISAVQLAALAGTIPWEILCSINPRVHRIFTD